MKLIVRVGVLAALAGAVTIAAAKKPAGPSDRYATLLAGKTLEEGKGFPGVITLGTPTPDMYKALGPGRETMGMPFWYFYDRGPWTLVVVAERDDTGQFRTRALQVSGAGAPATKQGVRIGDAAAKVAQRYGKPTPFSSTVGSPELQNMVAIDARTGARLPAPDAERRYKDSLYYPALGTLFAIDGGKVSAIVVLLQDDPLPVFLRDPKTVTASRDVVLDPKVDAPAYEDRADNRVVLRVPPPPPLATAKEAGFTIDAPKAWKKTGTRWTDPSGTEVVEVIATQAAPGEAPAAYFAAQEAAFGTNRVPPKQRVPPPELDKLIGADRSYALWKQEGGKGKQGAPLRTYVLMAAKGDRRFTVVVSRTANGAMPSPDGEALARGVFRSLRIH